MFDGSNALDIAAVASAICAGLMAALDPSVFVRTTTSSDTFYKGSEKA